METKGHRTSLYRVYYSCLCMMRDELNPHESFLVWRRLLSQLHQNSRNRRHHHPIIVVSSIQIFFSLPSSHPKDSSSAFLSKATETVVEWVQMPGMKPGPDSIGIIAISHGCTGVAARACGLVGLKPTRVAEILKDRPSWFRDCRALDVLNVLPTANGGTIELLYMQLYAPTTLTPASDFWLLRYTSVLEDGSLVVCEKSLKNTQNGPSMPPVQHFMRAEMLPSGYLIRPCEGVARSCILLTIWIWRLAPWSVPEVLRPLYESSTVLSQKITMAALQHLRQIAQEISQGNVTNWGHRPAALQVLSQRLSKGFNEALNGFTDEGWSMMGNDGMDDVTILVNSSPDKLMGSNLSFTNGFVSVSNDILCAKASMLLQNVPPVILLRFLREHRSEWADHNIDAYSAAAMKVGPCSLAGSRVGSFGGQVILPLAYTIEHEETFKNKRHGFLHILRCFKNVEETLTIRDVFLKQPYNLQWFNDSADVKVTRQVLVPFSVGRYEDEVLCDVIPMEAGHLLLGRPWQFDKKVLLQSSCTPLTIELLLLMLDPCFVYRGELGPAYLKFARDYNLNRYCPLWYSNSRPQGFVAYNCTPLTTELVRPGMQNTDPTELVGSQPKLINLQEYLGYFNASSLKLKKGTCYIENVGGVDRGRQKNCIRFPCLGGIRREVTFQMLPLLL
ncbi:hypothetical protein K2173_003069 [Erythroxylum novogranatense]|uniref:START domain-containing protein n=1 Tax=Erythroxylum novogranatense TaxID=1862640 RepID=A0AAV8S8A3_9ROSI|nr:hypothetical protein K2173_003069 [Erythroxylum novogranatense]